MTEEDVMCVNLDGMEWMDGGIKGGLGSKGIRRRFLGRKNQYFLGFFPLFFFF